MKLAGKILFLTAYAVVATAFIVYLVFRYGAVW